MKRNVPLFRFLIVARRALRVLCATGALALAAAPAYAQLEFIICDSSMDRVVRLKDVDGSLAVDAAAPGEVIVFYDDESPGPDLSTPSGVALGSGGELYLVDGGTLDAVLRLEDANGDGDANDDGEFQVFFDDSAGGPALATPNAVVVAPDGSVWLADDGGGRGRILRLIDQNDDGDALDEGEWSVVYDSELAADAAIVLTDPEALAIAADGTAFVADAEQQAVFALADVDGDGAVSSDDELSEFYSPEGKHPFADPEALAFDAGGVLHATDEDTGVIVALEDIDGDGLARGSGEVRIVVDESAPTAPRDTNDMTALPGGGLVVLDGSRDQVFFVRDIDGDGVAFSEGEVTAWLDSEERIVGTPSGIAVLGGAPPPPPPASFRRGDVNDDAVFNLTDAVFILGYLFLGGPAPGCIDSADVNDDGAVAISDAVSLLDHLFLGGDEPEAPFPDPGEDPTPDELDC